MAWQMPTSSSDWKELRLGLSRSSPQTIRYRPKLFDAEPGLAQPKRTSDRGSALSGTGRWLAAVDPRARCWLPEASISDWHLGCIVCVRKDDSHGMDCSGVSLNASFIALWSSWGTSPHTLCRRLPKQAPRWIARATQGKGRCPTDQTRPFGQSISCRLNWTFGACP